MTTTDAHDELVDTFMGMHAETLEELRAQVGDVLPDLALALADLDDENRAATGVRRLGVTVANLTARLAALDEAVETNSVAAQSL